MMYPDTDINHTSDLSTCYKIGAACKLVSGIINHEMGVGGADKASRLTLCGGEMFIKEPRNSNSKIQLACKEKDGWMDEWMSG